jgi:undecaprenyl-diphosphatase
MIHQTLKIADYILAKKFFLICLAIAAAFIGSFIELTAELYDEKTIRLIDKEVLLFIEDLRKPLLNGMAVDFTAMGSFTVIALLTALGLLIFYYLNRKKDMLYLFLGSVGSALLSSAFKNLLSRKRPTEVTRLVDVTSFSYPSGHSLSSAAFYLIITFLFFQYFKKIRTRFVFLVFFSSLIIGIGLSRIYLGVHYPSDVLGGILLGSSWAFLLTAFFYGESKKNTLFAVN